MALIPMATSWLSKNVNAFLPEFFYFIVYCFGSVAYYVLDNRIFAYQNRIGKTMQREGIIRHFWIDLALFLIGIILIPIIPISGGNSNDYPNEHLDNSSIYCKSLKSLKT